MESVYVWLIPAMFLAWAAYCLIAARGTSAQAEVPALIPFLI